MDAKIIPADEGERDFFAHVHNTAYREVIEQMFGWDAERQKSNAYRAFDEGYINLILLDNEKAGVIGWEERDDYFWLKEFFLLPEYQNQGFGSKILEDYIDVAKARKMDIRLRTLKANMEAKKLYERYGFEVMEATDIHWKMIYKVT